VIAEKTQIPDIIEWLSLDKLHVHAPTTAVLVCGGINDITVAVPQSYRHAFMKLIHTPPFSKLNFRLAEEADLYRPQPVYSNWMDFESDLAQIFQLVMLFCESEGSIAELGTFANIDEISRKLLIIIDEVNRKSKGYVTLGPIGAVEGKYGRASVFVVNFDGLNIPPDGNVSDIDLAEFGRRLSTVILEALERHKDPRTFDPARTGHVIKLVTGMIQHFGALTVDEIDVILFSLGLKVLQSDIQKYIECAKFLDWIVEDERGQKTYFAAIQEKDAFEYVLKDADNRPKLRKSAWRAQVRQYWQEKDPERFSVIRAATARMK
jgi:hypothetical protein